MAGLTTNGVVLIGPVTFNGVAASPPAGVYTQPLSSLRFMADTSSAAGAAPQSVAATAFQIAAEIAGLIANGATSTAGAATLNNVSGLITTEALTTAVGATYSFVLTNSLITAGSALTIVMKDKSCTTGTMELTSVDTRTAGQATIVFTNRGAAALNGTKLIAFHVP